MMAHLGARRTRRQVRAAVAAAILSLVAPARGWTADYSAAVVADLTSGQVLFSHAAEEPRFPASLTKMMTLYLLFEDLERGRLSLESPLVVSDYAAAQSPTKLGLRGGEAIRAEDAIRALVTHSANDAAVTVAENLEGSEPAFAARMTRTAHQIGMNGTQFRNASGLPDPNQYSTAWDMMVLGAALQSRFPRYFAYFKTGSFSFRGRTYRNHNHLLGRIDGVDGIKTGYTRASGFNLVTSIRRGGRTFVAVVMGGATAKSRDQRMEEMIGAHLPGVMVANAGNAERPSLSHKTQARVAGPPANASRLPKTREASALSP